MNTYAKNRNKLRFRGFTGGSLIKNLPANAGDVCLIPASKDPLGKEMAKIPLSEEPGRLQTMGLLGFGHN